MIDCDSVAELDDKEPFGTITTFGPKARNSVVRRRLASTCKLRRAAVTAAPAPSASSMTNIRPRLAPSRRRRIRQNIARLVSRSSVITRLARWARARCARRVEGERSEEHTSELQSRLHLVCRLLLEKKKIQP